MTDEPTLADLIEIASKRHNGASGRRLAELAHSAQFDVSHATLNRIRTGKYRSRPSDSTLRAIAHLSGLPEERAFAAADRADSGDDSAASAAASERRRKRLALDLALSVDRLVWFGSRLDPDDPRSIDHLIDEIDPHITNALDLIEDIYGGSEQLQAAKDGVASRAERVAEFEQHARKLGRRISPLSGSDPQPSTLTHSNQGSQHDYDLAQRKGETESEWRERTGNNFE